MIQHESERIHRNKQSLTLHFPHYRQQSKVASTTERPFFDLSFCADKGHDPYNPFWCFKMGIETQHHLNSLQLNSQWVRSSVRERDIALSSVRQKHMGILKDQLPLRPFSPFPGLTSTSRPSFVISQRGR